MNNWHMKGYKDWNTDQQLTHEREERLEYRSTTETGKDIKIGIQINDWNMKGYKDWNTDQQLATSHPIVWFHNCLASHSGKF